MDGIADRAVGKRPTADERLAEPRLWAQTLLHALCRAVYIELAALRTCAFIGLAHLLSRSAGRRRRRVSSGRAGYSCGHLSASEASGSIRPLQHGHRHRPGDWPAPRWMDHR